MGLKVTLYRNDYTSKNSLFAYVDSVIVTNMPGPFNPSPDMPAATLTKNAFGDPIIEPDVTWMHENDMFVDVPEREAFMNGGAFASTSDSRFGRTICEFAEVESAYFALPVHDYSFTLESASRLRRERQTA